MIRSVLAVVVAVALVGSTVPVLSDARVATAHERVDVQRDAIERTANALAAESVAVAEGEPAARRSVTLQVPASSVATAGVDRFGIGCPRAVFSERTSTDRSDERANTDGSAERTGAACEPAVVYRVDGGTPTVLALPDVPLATPEGPVLLEPGAHRVTFRYVREGSNGDAETVIQVVHG